MNSLSGKRWSVIDGAGKGIYAWNAPQGVPIGDKRMEVDRRERGMLLIGWQSSVARHTGWGRWQLRHRCYVCQFIKTGLIQRVRGEREIMYME